MVFWTFLSLLLLITAFVLWRGGREERTVIGILFAAYVATYFLYRVGEKSWLVPKVGVLVSDTIASILLIAIALRSKRFWPLPVAAFQIIPVLTQFAGMFGQNLVSYALGVTQGVWSYFQLAILVFAASTTRHETPEQKMTETSSQR